jgi:phosphohistidine phosphatase
MPELEAGARPDKMATLIEARFTGEELMLVGHNPDLEELIAYLISPTAEAAVNLKKGALALVRSARPLACGQGELRWLLTAAQLARMGNKGD